MKLNDGYENATTLDELRTYVEYSGNEAEILKSYYGHRKCKSRFRYSFSTRMTELPQQFYDEWNGKIKSFKERIVKDNLIIVVTNNKGKTIGYITKNELFKK